MFRSGHMENVQGWSQVAKMYHKVGDLVTARYKSQKLSPHIIIRRHMSTSDGIVKITRHTVGIVLETSGSAINVYTPFGSGWVFSKGWSRCVHHVTTVL